MKNYHIWSEVVAYSVLALVLVLVATNIPLSKTALIFISLLIGPLYFFLFRHWFRDEGAIGFKIFGMFSMILIPIAITFLALDYPGKYIVFIAEFLIVLIYWIIRYSRKTFRFEFSFQTMWLLILIFSSPIVFLVFEFLHK